MSETLEMSHDRVPYNDMNSKQKEMYNFHKIAAVLADYGYYCMKLSDDWNGADFIASHVDGTYIPIQLKSRFTIDKKYLEVPNLHLAFPFRGSWYVAPHNTLVEIVKGTAKYLDSQSWKKEGGGYSTDRPSETLMVALERFRF